MFKTNAILKKVTVKNNDTDSYISIYLDIDNEDVNSLIKLKHQALTLTLKKEYE